MSNFQKPVSFSKKSELFPRMEKLKKVYNIKTNSKLLEHLVDLDIKRQ